MKTKENRKPRWMVAPLPTGKTYSKVKNLIAEHNLHTICTSGNCPNKGECWSAGTATFMILGTNCTRGCRFCDVDLHTPEKVDTFEPARLAQTIKTLELKHCVITSVTRDDLEDGGAAAWAKTIRAVKHKNPDTTMEVLIPDFDGKPELLDLVINEKPNVISHNLETVKRLTPVVRDKFSYLGSLKTLKYINDSGAVAKSGVMLGLGETVDEVKETLLDMHNAGVKVVTIGQYLAPSSRHAKVAEYVKPEIFEQLKEYGLELGFKYVESGPLVRSSYHAERHVNAL